LIGTDTQQSPLFASGHLVSPHGIVAATQLLPPTHLYPDGQPVVLRSVQVVVQLVEEAQSMLLGQFPGEPGMHVPLPLHWPRGV
jgi:hypothetical protein